VTDKLAKIVRLIREPRLTRELLALASVGYLQDSGWNRSLLERLPVDAHGRPIPWMTLPFIDFIATRLTAALRVFEYGCGNSTLYYADHVGSVTSVEHDVEWHRTMQAHGKRNVTILLQALERDADYARTAAAAGGGFHLVIVDGRDRVNCVRQGVLALTPDGCVVLDDSEREEYQPAADFLRDAGFRRLDFWGVAPGLSYRKCTTIFYRSDNCLGI